jgi:PleD family two-component response regulator
VVASASDSADVLVIDDSDIARGAMVRALRMAGLSVIDLPSPIGATRAIIRSSVRLVVIDINMPSMRGDKLAALFRSSERFKDIKLVLISGADIVELRSLAREVKANGVVAKSEGNDVLVSTVRGLLEET